MSHFKYARKELLVEKSYITNIAKYNKTPFYLYSEKQLKENFLNFKNDFKDVNPLICFSVKSNSNIKILSMLGKLGSGADVVSGGELMKVLRSGIKPNKIVFSGVGKSEEELKLAIKKRILLINVESESEAILINRLSKNLKNCSIVKKVLLIYV